jgi:hypothetical protein
LISTLLPLPVPPRDARRQVQDGEVIFFFADDNLARGEGRIGVVGLAVLH